MKKRKLIGITAMGLSLSMLFTACSATAKEGSVEARTSTTNESTSVKTVAAVSDMFTERDLAGAYDEKLAEQIVLKGDTAESTSSAVAIDGSTVTITDENVYIISGRLTDGMIIVEADKTDKIQLVLNNADITSSDSAAIYVRQADKVFITLPEGTSNTLTNGGAYTAIDENNIDAVIFSKEDLTVNGTGSLTLNGSEVGHGIVSKDDLVLASASVTVTAASHGFSGKDSVRIASGSYDITSGKDGIHSENSDYDTLGFVYIENGDITINAGDDGVHAGASLTICGGSINIAESYEGLEGNTVELLGGIINVKASDDGINAAGGKDQSGFGGKGTDWFSSTGSSGITISGGKITVDASGDGIDANGYISVTGGETYVSGPTNSANGALDYDSQSTVSGGTFVATGAAGMAMNFGQSSTQGSVLFSFNTQSAGSEITLKNESGDTLVSYTPAKAYGSVTLSCPELVQGGIFTLTAGDHEETFTLNSLIYGSSGGFGGRNMPGNGQMPQSGQTPWSEQTPGDAQTPQDSQIPQDGQMPQRGQGRKQLPDGEMPELPDGSMPNEGFRRPDGEAGGTSPNEMMPGKGGRGQGRGGKQSLPSESGEQPADSTEAEAPEERPM